MKHVLPLAVVVAGFSLSALAQTSVSEPRDPSAVTGANSPTSVTFESLDKNKDGKISKDEASASSAVAASFDAADKNGDGAISKQEFKAYFTG